MCVRLSDPAILARCLGIILPAALSACAGSEPYPDLADIPARPAPVNMAERATIVQSLAQDQAQATKDAEDLRKEVEQNFAATPQQKSGQ